MNDLVYASTADMLRAITDILQGRVHSAWLYGSVVFDDFHLGWSDIDLLVLSDETPSESQAERLLTLRQQLSEREKGNPYFRCFEGVIMDREAYETKARTRLVYWGTSGQRITDHHELDVFSQFSLARYGKRIGGYGEKNIFREPSEADLIRGVRAHCACIRKYAVLTDERLYSCGWLLDIARCLYTLRYRDVIAKTRAGEWALNEHLFPGEEALTKTLRIRRDPLRWKDDAEIKKWLRQLGPTVQACADVLEKELNSLESDN